MIDPNQPPYAAYPRYSGRGPRPGRVRVEAISDAWSVIKRDYALWIALAFVYYILYFACLLPYFAGTFTEILSNPKSDQFELQQRYMPALIAGNFAMLLLSGLVNAGAMRMALVAIRGGDIRFGDAFKWNRQSGKIWATEAAYALLGVIPVAVPWFLRNANQDADLMTRSIVMSGLQYSALAIVALILLVFTFTPMLIIDKGMAVGEAVKTSVRTAGRHYGMLLLVLFLAALIIAVGACALMIGIFFTQPFYWVTRAIIYNDLFGPEDEPQPDNWTGSEYWAPPSPGSL